MTADEEKRVIERVCAGETEAFEALVLAHQKNVYNLALKMLGSEEDAADVSQEAFFKAYTALDSFRGDCRFSVWLYRLTSNLCLDLLRRKKRRNEVPLNVRDPETGEDAQPEIPDERFAPEALAEKRALHEALRGGLASLPDGDRQILTLREIGALSYEEIASSLSLELGTVKSRLFRARKKLCAYLVKTGNFSDDAASKERKEV